MKIVVSSNEVCHLWAHKAQPEARNAKSSLFFRDSTIYSYGSHFPIARHVWDREEENYDNPRAAVLFTSQEHSVTTARHKSAVRQAIPNRLPVFTVDDVMKRPTEKDVHQKETEAAQQVLKARRARVNKSWHLDAAQRLLTEAQALNDFFALGVKVKTLDELGVTADAIAQARKEELEKARIAEARRVAEAQEALAQWIGGAHVYVPHLRFSYARIEGNELITTKGARVPLSHVQKASKVVRKIIEAGKAWHTNGHKIPLGHYQLDSISEDGVLTAGCHVFERAEVLRILDLVDAWREVEELSEVLVGAEGGAALASVEGGTL